MSAVGSSCSRVDSEIKTDSREQKWNQIKYNSILSDMKDVEIYHLNTLSAYSQIPMRPAPAPGNACSVPFWRND